VATTGTEPAWVNEMSGLNHAFWLVRTADHPPAQYRHFVRLPGEVEIHDDLLRYMGDTLHWIPAHNPARRGEPCLGLCMWGVTSIHPDGARAAGKVFSSWATLFALGPKELDLTGSYAWIVGDDPRAGAYERLVVDRGDVGCSRLNRLAGLCEQVSSGGEDLYLLHCGI
jgi:hypothetical protein